MTNPSTWTVAHEDGRPTGRARLRRPLPLHTLLVAAYAVLLLFADNVAEVSFGEVLPPLGRALVVATAVAVGAGLVLRDLWRGALVATAVVAFWFAYGHVDALVGHAASRDERLAVWALVVALSLGAAIVLRERWIVRATRLLNTVTTILLGITVVQVLRSGWAAPIGASERGHQLDPLRSLRDVYLLVWDRYGSQDAVYQLGAGRDLIEDWLESRGFYVARQAHANYGRTVLSLAATLNMTSLEALATRMGSASDNESPIHSLIQDHAVGRFLKGRGYRYVHIGSWFAPTRTVAIADENVVMGDGADFEARLERSTFEPTLDELLGVPEPPAHHVLHRTTALWQMREFDRIHRETGPKFVLLHVLLPHEPYVFDDDGSYPSDADRAARGEGENYRRQRVFADDQMKRIVDQLLDARPDRQPVVIIAGDEGPFPVRYAADQMGFDWAGASTSELQTKYGILNAFFLPGSAPDGALAPYPTVSSWNTFRIVLDRYFGQGLGLLPDRSFTSRAWKRPYDLTEITDRLPAPYGRAARQSLG